jgi:hypothetical protein
MRKKLLCKRLRDFEKKRGKYEDSLLAWAEQVPYFTVDKEKKRY